MTPRDVIADALFASVDGGCLDQLRAGVCVDNADIALEALEAAGYRVVRQEVVPHIKIAGDDRPLWWDMVGDAPGETPA